MKSVLNSVLLKLTPIDLCNGVTPELANIEIFSYTVAQQLSGNNILCPLGLRYICMTTLTNVCNDPLHHQYRTHSASGLGCLLCHKVWYLMSIYTDS